MGTMNLHPCSERLPTSRFAPAASPLPRLSGLAALAVSVAITTSAPGTDLTIANLGQLVPGLSAEDEQHGTAAKWQAVRGVLRTDADRVVVQQLAANLGGNTSVRNESPLVWKQEGYYRRARDLGQVFTAPQDFALDAIVLRTGNDSLAFLPGTAGSEVFVQFFEVTGEPTIHDNGTPPGTEATHGFSKNHRCDDYLTGVGYLSLRVVTGGRLPNLATRGDGRLTYMKWSLTASDELCFKAGKRYAFMIGFAQAETGRNFTLANRNNANSPEPPAMTDATDIYHGGWGIRREGNGENPPLMAPGATPPSDIPHLARLRAQAQFPLNDARFTIPPTTEGYPDVCTYRDLEFYLLQR